MNVVLDIGRLLAGLVLLIIGAELLVRGAARLALGFGIPRAIVALTVVSLGTSSPELAISIRSATEGQTGLVLGNVIGSNIFNILAVLGLSALAAPLIVSRAIIRQDVPVMLGASIFLLIIAADGHMQIEEGGALLAMLALYFAWLIRTASVTRSAVDVHESAGISWATIIIFFLGLGLLLLGSPLLVDGAVSLAQRIGVSQVIIGITIIAVGTSAPEMVTSIVASIRGEREIAVGNAIGSNIMNIFGVLGTTVLASGSGIDVSADVISFDLPLMVVVAAACLPVFLNGHRIGRISGAIFVTYYATYIAFLILNASQIPQAPIFGRATLWFALPLTLTTLAVIGIRRSRSRPESG